MAPRPSSSELAGEVVATAEEATAGARDGLDVFAVVVRWCVRSLGVSGALVWPLGMSTGGGVEAASSWRSRQSGMLGTRLKGWACSRRCGGRVWVVGFGFWASYQGGGVADG